MREDKVEQAMLDMRPTPQHKFKRKAAGREPPPLLLGALQHADNLNTQVINSTTSNTEK